MTLLAVLLSRIVDVQQLSSRDVGSLWADLGGKLVDYSGVGEGASCHDLVITSPGTIGVKINRLHTLGLQVPGGR